MTYGAGALLYIRLGGWRFSCEDNRNEGHQIVCEVIFMSGRTFMIGTETIPST